MNCIEFGDCRDIMRRWASDGVRVQTCVTSPPYFGLRDYGHDGQIGLEQTPEQYIAAMVEVFRCVRDVLTDDGTMWLNLGDSYGAGKQLLGVPWRVALALQSDGWVLRQDIIWHKPNPMPESVRDRCTKAHEYIFLLSKSGKYFFDSESMKDPAVSKKPAGNKRHKYADAYAVGKNEEHRTKAGLLALTGVEWEKRNRRSVWTVATHPYKGAHFATFPPALIEPCILAGSRPGDIVLDPFIGSGTTAVVSLQHRRKYLGCELNREYEKLQIERINETRNLFTEAAVLESKRVK
jgi:DNA modification methylase